MKTRGTRGGILLSLDKDDTPENLERIWDEHGELLSGKVILEMTERLPWALLEAVAARVAAGGGEVTEVRPPAAVVRHRSETVVIARTVRSGGRVEASGSVVILGDVNAGAEIVAENDIIVIGTLRGVAHAGASGNEQAFIWAQRILSPQLRIAGALAQADAGAGAEGGPEVAHLRDGQIVLRPWER
jgi:septum site-determining protein MinC